MPRQKSFGAGPSFSVATSFFTPVLPWQFTMLGSAQLFLHNFCKAGVVMRESIALELKLSWWRAVKQPGKHLLGW
jgi:hypothetical protein